MNVETEVLRLLDQVLSLDGGGMKFKRDTPLLGAVPELDSMAVVSLITAIEETFDVTIDDDDIDAATFASVGTLTDFIAARTSA